MIIEAAPSSDQLQKTPKPGATNTGLRQFYLTPKLRLKQQELIYLSRLSMPQNIGTELIVSEVSPPSTKKSNIPILHQLHGDIQVFRLKKSINQRNLTESLDLLEKSGVSGDFALFIIQNIQLLEVA